MEKMILIPYREYLELAQLKTTHNEKEKWAIYYRPFIDKSYNYKNYQNDKNDNKEKIPLIFELELSVRTYHWLINTHENAIGTNDPNYRFDFIGDLVTKRPADFLKMTNFGRKSLYDLENALKQYEESNNLKIGTLKLGQELPDFVIKNLNALRSNLNI